MTEKMTENGRNVFFVFVLFERKMAGETDGEKFLHKWNELFRKKKDNKMDGTMERKKRKKEHPLSFIFLFF